MVKLSTGRLRSVERSARPFGLGVLTLEAAWGFTTRLGEHIILAWVADKLGSGVAQVGLLKEAIAHPIWLIVFSAAIYCLFVVAVARHSAKDGPDDSSGVLGASSSTQGPSSPSVAASGVGRDVIQIVGGEHHHHPPEASKAFEKASIKRPWIRVVKYTKVEGGVEGLLLAHEGETAYNVATEFLIVGQWTVTFEMLPEVKKEVLAKVLDIRSTRWEGNNVFGIAAQTLDTAWRSSKEKLGYIPEKLPIVVSYTDFRNKRFRCECAIERDVNIRGDVPFRIVDCEDVPC